MDGKVCSRCSIEQPIDQYIVTDRKTGRRNTWCKTCERARANAHYAKSESYRERRKAASKLQVKTPEASRRHRLKHKYSLTETQFDALLETQNHSCALCGTTEVGNAQWERKYFYVDHDHATGVVRGLLCHACNARLGSYEALRDRIGIEKIRAYLAKGAPDA
jgi:hypothetical protein